MIKSESGGTILHRLAKLTVFCYNTSKLNSTLQIDSSVAALLPSKIKPTEGSMHPVVHAGRGRDSDMLTADNTACQLIK